MTTPRNTLLQYLKKQLDFILLDLSMILKHLNLALSFLAKINVNCAA